MERSEDDKQKRGDRKREEIMRREWKNKDKKINREGETRERQKEREEMKEEKKKEKRKQSRRQ